jgi:phage shock protein E
MDHPAFWIFTASFTIYLVYRSIKFSRLKKEIPALLAEGAVIVDVRSTAEFQAASNPGSINIPLDRFLAGIAELKKEKPVILCCASGARSGAAAALLRARGFRRVVNAGPWTHTL